VQQSIWVDVIIILYVDDLIVTGDENLIKYCKEGLAR